MEHRRGLIRPPRPAAILIAAAVLVFGIAGALEAAAHGREHRRANSTRSVSSAQVALAQRVESALHALTVTNVPNDTGEASARRTASRGDLVAVAITGRDSVVQSDSVAPLVGGPLTAGQRLDADLEVAGTLALAADSGEVRASAPVSLGTSAPSRSVLLVEPRYAPGQSLATTAQRRAALTGYAFGVLDVERLAAQTFASLPGPGGAVEIRDGDAVLFSVRDDAAPGRPSSPVVQNLSVAGRTWTVTSWVAGGAGGLPWLIFTAAVICAAGVIVLGIGAATSRARDEHEAARNRREFALVLESGALLQRSLDLADVLPSFAVTLSDEFNLEGITVMLAEGNGQLVELFSMGARPASLPTLADALVAPPDSVEGGHPLFVPLHRAGRAIGALWLLPREPLSPGQLDAVRAIADLAGSAVANAELYRKEQETARRLRELDTLKNDFIGTVSHELRTPVTAIKGFSAILESSGDQLDDEQRRDLIARIARNSTSLGTMLNGLLDFARLERRSMALEVARIDLAAAVRNVVDQMGSMLDQQELDVDAAGEVIAYTDTYAVERIVSNLLSNAAKFSPPGTRIQVQVRRSATDAGDRALVAVEDEGPGIPPEERGRIFSRFYRGSGEGVMRTRGAGIGLAVVQEFADRIGATVSVSSGRSGGARFTVSFPTSDPTVDGAARDEVTVPGQTRST